MRIGCLGLGNMGQPMAGKLLDGGHELWVYDVREEAMLPLLRAPGTEGVLAESISGYLRHNYCLATHT
jgi:3-hydroxyisobutyrate dehydrogenase-like beta-hydroxyacid dehydrogenase